MRVFRTIFLFILVLCLPATAIVQASGATPLGPVINFIATANKPSNNFITLTWSAPSLSTGLTAYKLTFSPHIPAYSQPANPGILTTLDETGKVASLTTAPWTNNVTFPQLPLGNYSFSIVAVNAAGAGSATQVSTTLSLLGPPVTATATVDRPVPASVSLVWSPPVTGTVGITAYKVTVSPPVPLSSKPNNPGITTIVNESGLLTSFTTAPWTNNAILTALPPSLYNFTISAVSSIGVGAAFSLSTNLGASAVQKLTGLPNFPVANSLTLTWSPPVTGTVGITAYKVTVSPPVPLSSKPNNPGITTIVNESGLLTSFTTAPWTNNVTFASLLPNTYSFTLTPVAQGILGTQTTILGTITSMLPGPPATLTSQVLLPSRNITVIWSDPTLSAGPILAANIKISPSIPASSLPTNPGIVPTYDNSGMLVSLTTAPWTRNVTFLNLPGAVYTISVAHTTTAGTGTFKETTATIPVAPSTPANLTATVGDSAAKVSWSAVINPGSATLSYTVTATATGQATRTCTTSLLTCTVVQLTNGTPYLITLAASTPLNGASVPATTSVTPGLSPALTPTFTTPIPTGSGFTTQILNYDPTFTYTNSISDQGSVTIDVFGFVTVANLTQNTMATLTVTTNKKGYYTGSDQVSTNTGSKQNLSTLVATGDIACSPTNPSFNLGNGTLAGCRQRAVSQVIKTQNPQVFMPLGDVQYDTGTLADYNTVYDQDFGSLKPITNPVAGNHEYGTANAAGYFTYFGQPAHPMSKGIYSFDTGGWHVVVLNSMLCTTSLPCDTNSTTAKWLQNDIATHPSSCLMAAWHHPLFSAGIHGNYSPMLPIWNQLHSYGADIILDGHDHLYERSKPLGPATLTNGVALADPSQSGITEFVVGTGGANNYKASGLVDPKVANIYAAIGTNPNPAVFGALRLDLQEGKADFSFQAAAGSSFQDSGTITCRGKTPPAVP